MRTMHPLAQAIADKCAWCGQSLGATPFPIHAKLPVGLKPGPDAVLQPFELKKAKRIAHALVMQPGSEGKKQGIDVSFGCCSEDCRTKLKKAIEEEINGFRLSN